MVKEKKLLKGIYTVDNVDINGNIKETFIIPNIITNEGASFLVQAIVEPSPQPIDWKFRVGDGRNFTYVANSYEGIDPTDIEIKEVDVGSIFYKQSNNTIILNGIVLSNEGFVETVAHDADLEPRENEVSVRFKKNPVLLYGTVGDIFGSASPSILNNDMRSVKAMFDAGVPSITAALQKVVDRQYDEIKFNTVEIDGWLTDIDEDTKWNNISLVAIVGSNRYMFSRIVLPPMFKAKGVRQIIKYTLLL